MNKNGIITKEIVLDGKTFVINYKKISQFDDKKGINRYRLVLDFDKDNLFDDDVLDFETSDEHEGIVVYVKNKINNNQTQLLPFTEYIIDGDDTKYDLHTTKNGMLILHLQNIVRESFDFMDSKWDIDYTKAETSKIIGFTDSSMDAHDVTEDWQKST